MITPIMPTPDELAPYLAKLEAAPGSVVLVAIELPENQNFPRVGVAHFRAEARQRLRGALLAKKRREGKPSSGGAE